MESIETRSQEKTPERGTVNDDGSVNLGLRRRPDHPLTIESDLVIRQGGDASIHPSASEIAAHRQAVENSRILPNWTNDENRLPPMTSMSAVSDRQSSLSPASFLSPTRKRSFSATETESTSGGDGVHESAKRISSIKSILNPQMDLEGHSIALPLDGDRGEYSLPPLRNYPKTSMSGHSTGGFTSINASPGPRELETENERLRGERRLALTKEADRMRELLAAKERELLELGD